MKKKDVVEDVMDLVAAARMTKDGKFVLSEALAAKNIVDYLELLGMRPPPVLVWNYETEDLDAEYKWELDETIKEAV